MPKTRIPKFNDSVKTGMTLAKADSVRFNRRAFAENVSNGKLVLRMLNVVERLEDVDELKRVARGACLAPSEDCDRIVDALIDFVKSEPST